MTYAIIDLDNCISADAWRRNTRAPNREQPFERFHVYHSLSAFDDFHNEWVTRIAEQNIILTARPLWYRAMTEHWLFRKNINVKHLLMRNNDDHRPSLTVKRDMINQLWAFYDVPKSKVILAVDDIQEIVIMYLEDWALPATRVFIEEGE